MTSNRSPRDVARAYWLQPLLPEQMPDVATQLLVEGYDTPALCLVAGVVHPDPRDVREAFIKALQELGVWLPDERSAQRLLARDLARDLHAGRVTLAETAARIRRCWELDEVIDPDPSSALDDFVLMGWLHGADEAYEPAGGDSRFLGAATALLDDDPPTSKSTDAPA
jgi:hypothetical protein